MRRQKAEITITVSGGAGESGYSVTIKGERLAIIKSLCDIYGGYLESYDVSQWYDSSEQTNIEIDKDV